MNRIATIRDDDGTDVIPIQIDFDDSGETKWTDPEKISLYFFTRKFKKGDIVRRIDTGRGNSYENHLEIGKTYTVANDENDKGNVWVYFKGMSANPIQTVKWYDLELVKTIEDIEKEAPYTVENVDDSHFKVCKGTICYYEIWYKIQDSLSFKEEARKKAQELCDELNSKHRESLTK